MTALTNGALHGSNSHWTSTSGESEICPSTLHCLKTGVRWMRSLYQGQQVTLYSIESLFSRGSVYTAPGHIEDAGHESGDVTIRASIMAHVCQES